jgi:glycosyltransferase involved in cell wall biosynthesis
MPQVVLLPPLPTDNNKSMDVYARELVSHYKALGLPYAPFIADIHFSRSPHPNIPDTFPVKLQTKLPDTYYDKYIAYPGKAADHKKNIVHIIDHSYGHLAYGLPDTRKIITCHDLTLFKFKDQLIKTSADKDKFALFQYSVKAMTKASAILADSKATQSDIEKYLGIPSTKVHVVPLGVSELFRPASAPAEITKLKKKYGLSAHFTLLHVGNNAFYKNIGLILKALYVLVKKHKLPVKLLKAGADFTELQKMMIRNLELAPHILHLGDVPLKQLIALYNLADLYICPSLNEGFGLPALEAMACGLPVIASDRGALPSVIGKAGLLLPPKEHEQWAKNIKELLQNKKHRDELSSKGLERTKQFSWNATANRTFEVYQEVLGK